MMKKYKVKCLNIGEYEISLTKGKIYTALKDPISEKVGYIRVIDDSEEDYIYPKKWFEIIKSKN